MRPQQPPQPPPTQHRLPTMNSAITMNEIIEKEIEKNLVEQPQHRSPPGPAMSPQRLARHNAIPQPQQASMTRMSQVIEDSLRNHPGPRPSVIEDSLRNHPGHRPSDLEGLACPRTKSPNPPAIMPSVSRPLGPSPAGSGYPGGRPPPNEEFHEYPAMEGLGKTGRCCRGLRNGLRQYYDWK